MRKIDRREALSGVLLMALGIFVALYASSHYEIGRPSRMGPGFFPHYLGWCLAVVGAAIAVLSLRSMAATLPAPRVAVVPLVAVSAGILVFGLTLEWLGMVPAALMLTLIAGFAQRPYRIWRSALLAVGLAGFTWLVFRVILGMSLQAFA